MITITFIDGRGNKSMERFTAADALAELAQYRAARQALPPTEHTLIVDHDGVAHVFRGTK